MIFGKLLEVVRKATIPYTGIASIERRILVSKL